MSPDDQQKTYKTLVRSNLCRQGGIAQETIYSDRSYKDPLQSAMKKWFKTILQKPRLSKWGYSNASGSTFKDGDLDGVIWIKDCPFALSRNNGKYRLNGQTESVQTIASALSRVLFKSCFTDDNTVLMKTLFSSLSLPEDVKYALENRIPYHFYEDFDRQEVRLNVAQIDDKMFAIEIGDGVWGNITMKDLQSFCGYYIHGRKNSKFRRVGLKRLYSMLMNKEPRESDVKMMKAFLMQNRTDEIVESKARELVAEMVNNFPNRIKVFYDADGIPDRMYIKGNDYDWKLTNNKYKSDIQMVSTFVRQFKVDKETNTKNWFWSGPICIDNMARGSSLGDQFCTRALAVMNDNMTVARVNTLKGHLKEKPNENERIELNEVS